MHALPKCDTPPPSGERDSAQTRHFKGIWIPAAVWYSKALSLHEKLMLVEIHSLQDHRRGCYKSNAAFAAFFGLSKSRISEIIARLKAKGFIDITHIKKGNQYTERRIFLTAKMHELWDLEHADQASLGYSEYRSPPSENRSPPSEYRITPSENTTQRFSSRVIQRECSRGREHEHEHEREHGAMSAPHTFPAHAVSFAEGLSPAWEPDHRLLVTALVRLRIPEAVSQCLARDAELVGTFVHYQLAKHAPSATPQGWTLRLANWLLRDWQQLERPPTPEAYQHARGFVSTACLPCPLAQLHALWQSELGAVKPAPGLAEWLASPAAQELAARWQEGFHTPRRSEPGVMRYAHLDDALGWWQGFFAALGADAVLSEHPELSLLTLGQPEVFAAVIEQMAAHSSPLPEEDMA